MKLILVNLSILIGLIAVIEISFHFYHSSNSNKDDIIEEIYSGKLFDEDPNGVGYRSIPNHKVQVTKKTPREKIYDVTYNFDEFGRRKVPQKNMGQRKKYAVFLGDSNTFGEGLEDNQTLPYFFSFYNPNYHSYNYAVEGNGPTNILALLETKKN